MKKSLKDTYIYNVLGLDRTVTNCAAINSKLSDVAIKGDALEAIINEIKYKINFPAKVKILEELKNGQIVFVDSPEAAAIPAWLLGDGHGGVKTTVVNLFGKVKLNKEGNIQFNVREVFALAQIGYVIREFFTKETKITFNQYMSKLAVTIYCRMIYRVLDVLYSLDISPLWLRNAVKMEISFFAVSYLLEKGEDDNMFKFVLQDMAKQQGTTVDTLISRFGGTKEGMDEHGKVIKYQSLPNLIEHLSRMNPALKDLDISSFLRKFIMMYGEKALLTLESYSYFLALIMSVTVTGNVVKDFGLEPVVGKEGIELYNNFLSLTRQ